MSDVEIDPDAEREVDLRGAWERISARWWLPAGGLVLGLVLGWAVALGGGQVWKAEATLFLGQPFTPNGGGQIQSLATNPRTVGEIVRSEAALKAAAAKSGLRVAQLRGRISTVPITAPGQARGQTPLVQLSVIGPAPRKVELAAGALAQRVVENVSAYVEDKVRILEQQIASDERELESINRRLNDAFAAQQEAMQNRTLPLGERLLLVTSFNSTLAAGEQRRSTVQESLLTAQQLLSLAEKVERSRVIEPAVAVKTTARSTRNAALVAGLVGLLAGALAALFADAFAARRTRPTAV
jgi:hypothetical protein